MSDQRNPCEELGRLLQEVGAVLKIGLEAQGHLPTIEKMLDAGDGWTAISRVIGWSKDAAIEAYGEVVRLQRAALQRQLAEAQAFVNRCVELGAPDTDYIKHAIEDRERLLRDLAAATQERRTFPVQRVGLIPWSVAEQAYARYSQLYGRDQTLERLAERGGFGLAELGFLLRGYGRRQDGKEDDRDWQSACEHATKEILAALAAPH